MVEKIIVSARLELFTGDNMRQVSFRSNYRPVFAFKNARTMQSGNITLLDRESLSPGSTATVEITFLQGINDDRFFQKGEHFTFSEGGRHILGKGEIIRRIE